ncbi:hypothetical protein [Gimesia aquarii]|uniref:hypothetical protein n=1 Tax=Gimesia aquarii TaxID=2527964 RepID=UPI0011AAD649|nr:hypothetical protein [Gimesia aquarii]
MLTFLAILNHSTTASNVPSCGVREGSVSGAEPIDTGILFPLLPFIQKHSKPRGNIVFNLEGTIPLLDIPSAVCHAGYQRKSVAFMNPGDDGDERSHKEAFPAGRPFCATKDVSA